MELSKTYEEEKEEYIPNSLDLLMVEILKGLIIPEEPFFEPVENDFQFDTKTINHDQIIQHNRL